MPLSFMPHGILVQRRHVLDEFAQSCEHFGVETRLLFAEHIERITQFQLENISSTWIRSASLSDLYLSTFA